MGTDCAPLIANLFLFYYEYNFMKGLINIKTNINFAKRFSTTVRYIDDLLTLNNTRFQEEIPNIYPVELVLKRTTESLCELSYLDICIRIIDHKFTTKVFDKRDSLGLTSLISPFYVGTACIWRVYISASQDR